MKYEAVQQGGELSAKPLKRVTLTVDPDDHMALEALARRSDVSISWLVRRSIREFLGHLNADRLDPTSPDRQAGRIA